ncbi:MAG: hypothetical protein POELPBGB_00973 [Bacteroidia bacterium]|nr:hypothetical protein [Bacteroidia bacterium]
MKKLILSFSFLTLFSIASLAQSTKEEIVLVSFEQMSAAKAGVLNSLTYGKPGGFDQAEKAFIVKPSDNSKETLDKLMEEIKYKSPDCILKIMTIEKKVSVPVTK